MTEGRLDIDSKSNSNNDSKHENSDQMRIASVYSSGAGPSPAASNGNYTPGLRTVFSERKKQSVVLAASIGGIFSTLSAQTYLPALKVLTDDFHVSVSKINHTVTTYLILQGVTPMLIGSFADRLGRRPAYVICFVVYICAAGISGTQTLCQAVVADITTSAERGPSLGPLIGGALTDSLGWWSIFWFLTICAGVYLALIALFFPETCRPFVDAGTVRPPKTYEALWQLLKDSHQKKSSGSQPQILPSTASEGHTTNSTLGAKYLLTSLALLWNKELGLLLAYGGIVYSGINAISAALPTKLTEIYGSNSLETGLMFLPMAAGSLVADAVAGKAIKLEVPPACIETGTDGG